MDLTVCVLTTLFLCAAIAVSAYVKIKLDHEKQLESFRDMLYEENEKIEDLRQQNYDLQERYRNAVGEYQLLKATMEKKVKSSKKTKKSKKTK